MIITQNQRLQAAGLLAIAQMNWKRAEEAEKALQELVDPDNSGHTMDAVTESYGVDELLGNLKVTVDGE